MNLMNLFDYINEFKFDNYYDCLIILGVNISIPYICINIHYYNDTNYDENENVF